MLPISIWTSIPWHRWRLRLLALRGEPLVHFLAAAIALVGIKGCHDARARPVLELSRDQLLSLAQQFEQRTGRSPSQEDWRTTANILLEEEILFREAQARGLVADNRVRALLIEMMRTSLNPALAEPTDEVLRGVMTRLPEDARTLPAQISFEHVSFASADLVPADALDRLRKNESVTVTGEPVRLSNPFPLTFRPQMERFLGEPFAAKVFALPAGEWHGPIASLRGVHFVRVQQRIDGAEMPIEQLRPILRAQWLRERRDEAVFAEVERLRARYRIVIPEPPEGFKP